VPGQTPSPQPLTDAGDAMEYVALESCVIRREAAPDSAKSGCKLRKGQRLTALARQRVGDTMRIHFDFVPDVSLHNCGVDWMSTYQTLMLRWVL
jgi:hypothetical protein